jgi:hypothetical protein
MTNKQMKWRKFEQLEIAAVGEVNGGSFCLLGANCDPGRFEVMLDVLKLQDLVITACSKTPSLTQ